jgi:hypothetical protein
MTNQDGDENDERRRKTNEDANKFKKQCIVNLSKKKEGNEMLFFDPKRVNKHI